MKGHWVLVLVLAVILVTWAGTYWYQRKRFKKKLAELQPKPAFDDSDEPSPCGPAPVVRLQAGYELQCIDGEWQVVSSGIEALEQSNAKGGHDLMSYF